MALKHFDNITSAQKSAKGVVALSDNPNKGGTYGVGGLSASELKAWFDKLVNYVIDRLNTLQTALGNKDASGVGSDYIRVDCDGLFDADPAGGYSLSDIVSSLTDGKMASYLTASWDLSTDEDDDEVSATLQAILNDVAYQISTKGDASDLTALEGRMDDAEGDIDDLESAVTGNTGDIGDINTALGVVDGRLNAIESKDTGYDNHVGNSDIHVTSSDKSAWTAKYDKPGSGIPKSDMASAVQTSLGKADTALQAADIVNKADLVDGKVPADQLPSYVDDVEEYADTDAFPATGESGKIYVAKDTNKTYRWGGSAYTVISETLALGETSSTAYRGDRGKAAYDHSLVTSGNPHNVTKSDVGLGDVVNKGMDDAPTESSDKYVKSGGVKSAIDSAVSTAEGYADTKVAALKTAVENGSVIASQARNAKAINPLSEDSGTIQDAPFISQGTGTANNTASVDTSPEAKQLEKLGNTVVKNQLVDSTKFPDSDADFINGVKFTNNNDGTVTITVDSGGATETRYFSLYNPDGSTGSTGAWTIKNNDYLTAGVGYPTGISLINKYNNSIYSNAITKNTLSSAGTFRPCIAVTSNASAGTYRIRPILTNITTYFSGNENIPAELLTNPSHWSWYYQGDEDYNAGKLVNCVGRYLHCGQDRNLFKCNDVESSQFIGHYYIQNASQNYAKTANNSFNCYRLLVIPNRKFILSRSDGNNLDSTAIVRFVDKNFQLIGGNQSGYSARYGIFTTPANCRYIEFSTTLTLTDVIDVQLYYSPEEGGEGYLDNGTPIHYEYVEDEVYDTGNEDLLAFDTKDPDGTIHDNSNSKLLKTLDWSYSSEYGAFYASIADIKPFTNTYTASPSTKMRSNREITSMNDKRDGTIYAWASGGTTNIYIKLSSAGGDVTAFLTTLTDDDILEYEMADAYKTTSQGTQFPKNIKVGDYNMMWWTDTDGNILDIPQGVRLFYPSDYVLAIDTLLGYTNGDVTSLALKGELESGDPDTLKGSIDLTKSLYDIMQSNIGNTLRQILASAENISLKNTAYLDFGTQTFAGVGGNVFQITFTGANWTDGGSWGVSTLDYTNSGYVGSSEMADKTYQVRANGIFWIKDTSFNTAQFNAFVKGKLLAYKKA